MEHNRERTKKELGLTSHGMKGKRNAAKPMSLKKSVESIKVGLPEGTRRKLDFVSKGKISAYVRQLIIKDLERKLK